MTIKKRKKPLQQQAITLFDQIKENVILSELKAQQQYIQNCIISEEKNSSQFWNTLKTSTFGDVTHDDDSNSSSGSSWWEKNISYAKLDCLHNAEIKPDFTIEELPFDNVNGFDGAKEYDHHGYLTKLLIYCYQVLYVVFILVEYFGTYHGIVFL